VLCKISSGQCQATINAPTVRPEIQVSPCALLVPRRALIAAGWASWNVSPFEIALKTNSSLHIRPIKWLSVTTISLHIGLAARNLSLHALRVAPSQIGDTHIQSQISDYGHMDYGAG